MSRCSLRSFGPFVAVFLIAAVGAPDSSGVAQAGCGDYVHVGGAAPRPGMTGNHAGSRPDAAPFDVAGRSGRPPCDGPTCRQSPLIPLDPAPLSVSKRVDHKACLV